MINPNLNCADFCQWMLSISNQSLSGPQRTLVELIKMNAISGTEVTDTEWNNFQAFTAWRYPFYTVYINNQINLAPQNNNAFVSDWLDRLSAAGFAPPSYNTIVRLNSAFNFGQSQGVTSLIDYLWFSVSDEYEHCLIPLISTNVSTLTQMGTPAFTPNVGLSGSAGGYLKTGWIEDNDKVNWSVANCCLATITTTETQHALSIAGCVDSGRQSVTEIIPCWTNSNTYGAVSGLTSINYACKYPSGLTIVRRLSPNDMQLLKGTAKINNIVYAGNYLNRYEDYILARNVNNVASAVYPGVCQLWCRASGSVDINALTIFLQMLVTPLI